VTADKLTILYLGSNSGSSRHRALALERLGYRVRLIDPRRFIPSGPLTEKWIFETGGIFLERLIRRRILELTTRESADLVFVDAGELVGPELVRELRRRFGAVINYNIDDPFGSRDARKWRLYLRAVPEYDLVVVVRECNVSEAAKLEAKNILRVWRSADEVVHAPRDLTTEQRRKWASEVAFIGTWMPERGPLLARLIRLGIPLSIFGNRWERAKEWPVLEGHWRGPGVDDDSDYAAAVQCAKICLGLCSKGNRDLCTQRSFEIPYLGTTLCAERTSEHLELYRDKEEAVFWSTPEECATICKELLHDDRRRERIAENGRLRCLRNGMTNEHIVSQILEAAGVGTLRYQGEAPKRASGTVAHTIQKSTNRA
jgi:spore maturation protein CgeB